MKVASETRREIVYTGSNLSGLVDSTAREINYLLQEAMILETLESCLSEFLSASTAELNPTAVRGKVWLSRFNARRNAQDAFFIQFNPTANERVERIVYIQCSLAEGRFLSKEIRFLERDYPSYVTRDFVPLLRKLFQGFGFTILKPSEEFSSLK